MLLCGEIPLASDSFDVIVAGECCEHLQPGDVFSVLYECRRLLRLRGGLLLTTPTPRYLKNRVSGLSVLLEPIHAPQHTLRLACAAAWRKYDCLTFGCMEVAVS